jgi:hypothetical protein
MESTRAVAAGLRRAHLGLPRCLLLGGPSRHIAAARSRSIREQSRNGIVAYATNFKVRGPLGHCQGGGADAKRSSTTEMVTAEA